MEEKELSLISIAKFANKELLLAGWLKNISPYQALFLEQYKKKRKYLTGVSRRYKINEEKNKDTTISNKNSKIFDSFLDFGKPDKSNCFIKYITKYFRYHLNN